jgi:hypothetical protein
MHNIGVLVRIMESSNSNSSITRLMPVLLIFFGLLGLYYLYQYLFAAKSNNTWSLITTTQPANPIKPILFPTASLAPLYEGGEFTISTWIYIGNWTERAGYNKSILRIGGATFDTIRIYLGARSPKLYVRLHTAQTGASPGATTTVNPPDSLTVATYTTVYKNLQTDSGLLDNSNLCDLPEIPMQRWANIAVAVNGKTVDIYLDGKLARSCVLPNPFKVDPAGYTGSLLDEKGFGGEISTTTMYDSALNPETVYKNYMAGPEPISGIGGIIANLLAPTASITVGHTQTGA